MDSVRSDDQAYDKPTSEFYDQFWFRNVPKIEHTRSYMQSTLAKTRYQSALDAGCGHGICSVVLSEMCDEVVGVDISKVCVDTARAQANHFNSTNTSFSVQDLQQLDLGDRQFDLIWCWGVAMMAPDPLRVIDNLIKHLAPGGELYLGLYLRTTLSPIHQAVRWACINFMNTPRRKTIVLNFFAWLTETLTKLKGQEINLRNDNISIQTQVEDWYYPPHKTFYSIRFISRYLSRRGLEPMCLQDRVGRFKSATIFVVVGRKSNGQ